MTMSRNEQVSMWYDTNLDIKNRTIYFGPWQMAADLCTERWDWEVDDWSVMNCIKGLYLLDQQARKPIKIIWFSYGGDWDAGMALYDYIKHMKSPVDVEAYGRIRSMGTIILQSCRKRFVAQNCLFLIHYGTAEQGECHAKDHLAFAKELDKNNQKMEDIYLKRIREKRKRFTRAQLQELMKYDKYMTAREAVDLGLADKVIR